MLFTIGFQSVNCGAVLFLMYYSTVGDNESVLLLLLIPRLSYKTELLQSQLRQKVSNRLSDLPPA